MDCSPRPLIAVSVARNPVRDGVIVAASVVPNFRRLQVRPIWIAGRYTYYLALLAEASAQGGQTPEGLEASAEALVLLATSGVRWWEAELHRLRGELLLRSGVQSSESSVGTYHAALRMPHAAEAETCFQQALDIARRHQAKSLELRAAMSLSRLWQQQGKRAEAYEMLTPIYGWFTEGFDTADLQEAKALLEALT
jgi:predicted ATPase